MAIKELVSWGFILFLGFAATTWPQDLSLKIKKFQYQVLREVGRTSNWGNPRA